ncbi:MAG: hypothetical protein HOP08_13545 [Cyclobacteriaceae bacterium]|nr:hypothetical protein [Cyclobacteriaceae bacterium]
MTKKIIFLMLLASQAAFAQTNQIAKFFPAAAIGNSTTPTATGSANVQGLVSGYIKPVAEDFGSLMNNGWYSTAENHKKFGFDLQVTMNTIFAKSEQKTFLPSGLTGVSYNGSGTSDPAPTAYGEETSIPRFVFNSGPNTLIPFLGPGGGNISKDVPIGSLVVPTITGGIGLFANTDLRFRYTPAVTLSGTELKNWGVGIQHDIKQHIPGIKMAPFHLSLLLAYSQLTATTDLKGYYFDGATSNTYNNQNGIGETKGYTAQILVSKTFAVITFYGAIGYNSSKTTYDITGSYYVNQTESGIPLAQPVLLTNPFHEEYSVSGVRATGGIRLKFGPIALNSDYSYVNSNGMLTAGFGFSVR